MTAITTRPAQQQSLEAFQRDLPLLWAERPGQWVAYQADRRLGFALRKHELYQQCFRQGLGREEFVIFCIEPQETDPIYLDLNAKDDPMPATITVEEAQAKLKELIENLVPGEEIIITENRRPVAKLVGERPARPPRPAPGLGKGSIAYMAPDFDDPLEEFKEYLE